MFTNDKLTMTKYLYNFPTDFSEIYAYAINHASSSGKIPSKPSDIHDLFLKCNEISLLHKAPMVGQNNIMSRECEFWKVKVICYTSLILHLQHTMKLEMN